MNEREKKNITHDQNCDEKQVFFYKKTTRHLHTYYKYVYIISEPVHHTKHTQHVVHTMASVFWIYIAESNVQ